VGPVVYNSGGSGSISQFSGGTYRTLATNVPGVVGMTQTGRGLVVAIGNKLQYVSGGALTDVPHGTLGADGPWVSVATQPNGHLLGWAWNNGWGTLYDLDLGSGAVTSQDFAGQINDPLFNNRTNAGLTGAGPVANAGDIAVDGTGGVWVGNAEGDGANAHVYHALPGGSLQMVTGGPSTYYKPHVTATGDGTAYVTTSDYSATPYFSDVYRFSGAGASKVTLTSAKLTNSALFDLAVDRCYTTCSVALPGAGGGPTNTGKTASPLKTTPKTAKVTKAGLTFKLACRTDCTVSVSGKLAYAKAKKKRKKKASAAASAKLRTTKVKLKAGKTKTVVIKLSKGQRKAIKKAKKKKRKITANLKLKVTPKGGKATTRSLKLKVK
jgi:hypothetical protein